MKTKQIAAISSFRSTGHAWSVACFALCALIGAGSIVEISLSSFDGAVCFSLLAITGTFVAQQASLGGVRSPIALIISLVSILTALCAAATVPRAPLGALAVAALVTAPFAVSAAGAILWTPMSGAWSGMRLISGTVPAAGLGALAAGAWIVAAPADAFLSLGIDGSSPGGCLAGVLLIGFGPLAIHTGLCDMHAAGTLFGAAAFGAAAAGVAIAVDVAAANYKVYLVAAGLSLIALTSLAEVQLTEPAKKTG